MKNNALMKMTTLALASTLLMTLPLPGKEKDLFEEIAKQKNAVVPGLAPNPAPKLPDITLPWSARPAIGFKPENKIDTQEELDAELQRMREKFAPFMAELAPALPVVRQRTEIQQFQWKLINSEMREDEKGNLYTIPKVEPIPEPNPWKTVTIPHYSGPINKAEAHYRTEITLTEDQLKAEKCFLHFNGADYIVEIFLNGKKVGSHEGLIGSFEFDIKPYAKPGKNELFIKAFNDSPMMGDNLFLTNRKFGKKLAACGGMGWDEPGLGMGWHMCPIGFGLNQRCYIETRNAAYINDLFARPMLEKSMAEISVEVPAALMEDKNTTLRYSLYGQNFKEAITVDQSPYRVVKSSAPGAPGFTQVKFLVKIPRDKLRVWSLDEPWLYQVQVKVLRAGSVVDAAKRQFGMRSFVQSATSKPKGRFYLNNKEIKLRGANMMGNIMQCVKRGDFDQLRDDILLAKIANMNFWRMTQQPCQEEAYEYFDKLGLLAQTDMPLFVNIRYDQAKESGRQLVEMMRLIRSHPCNAVISYMNEPGYRDASQNAGQMIETFHQWDHAVGILNPGQVIKWCDGDYLNLSRKYSDHHCYAGWYFNHGTSFKNLYRGGWMGTRAGWMHGCGEYGAEGLESIATMKKNYPAEWVKERPDGTWDPRPIPRNQNWGHSDLGVRWYGRQKTMKEWVDASQNHQKQAVRLQTEAFRRDYKMNSTALHLLIDAWPACWMKSVMDCDRQAKPAYFAFRDALTPLSVNLQLEQSYAHGGDTIRLCAWVCNDTTEVPAQATLRFQTVLDGKVLQTGSAPAKVEASTPTFQGRIVITTPDVSHRQPLTVRLGLFDRNGKLLHDTAFDIDLFPAADKGKKLDNPGGQIRKLIGS
ncbi:MAG: hypothetical protein H7A51_14965 [Akkermansiaceae bacterium]|nr:hypothetical protein [Akkermansiaceae bacterium]